MVQRIIYFSGESWLGLKKLHQLTSETDYRLYVSLTDFDGKIYKAVYDHFQVKNNVFMIMKSGGPRR